MFGDRVESSLNEIITDYKSGNGMELEIHVRNVTKDVFVQLVGGLIGKKYPADIEHSINVVSQEPVGGKGASMIRKMIFNNGEKVKEEYMQKTRLRNPPLYIQDYLPYTVHLNRETPMRNFKSDQHALVRVRNRISFTEPQGKWRFDMTAVKSGEIGDIGNVLKTLRDQMFPRGVTTESYLETLAYNIVDQYEVEVEYVGKAAELSVADFNIIKTLFNIITPDYSHQMQYNDELIALAQLIMKGGQLHAFRSAPSLKRLANQAISLTKNSYLEFYPPVGFYLTDKADGLRCLVKCTDRQCTILADKLVTFNGGGRKTPIESPLRANTPLTPTSRIVKTAQDASDLMVVDAEFICRDGTCVLYVFDILVNKKEDVSDKPFSARVEMLAEAVQHLNELCLTFTNTTSDDGYSAFTKIEFVGKTFARLMEENLEKSFKTAWNAIHPYKIDGLIMTEPDKSYSDTTNYKWKPMEHNTIDFAVKRAPESMHGKKPYLKVKGKDIYLLFVGIRDDEQQKLGLESLPEYSQIWPEVRGERFYPIQFSPSSDPYAYIYYHDVTLGDIDNKIVELRRVGAGQPDAHWEFGRVREDRKIEKGHSYGNHYKIAETTYQNYIDPFPLEQLWNPGAVYFQKTASDMYKAPNAYKRFVISNLIKNNMENASWIVDLASGRGADLNRYHEVGVRNALFLDRDASAISELIRRKFDIMHSDRKQARLHFAKNKRGGDVSRSTAIHTMVADLTTDFGETLKRMEQFRLNPGIVDAVVCNFALHYLCDSADHLRNVMKLANALLRTNGVFMFTVMDGARVHELLKPLAKGESWTLKEDKAVKYQFVKQYEGNFANYGQMIDVKLPMTDELYREPLCNVGNVVEVAKKHGFAAEVNDPFTQYMEDFVRVRRDLFERLTPEDKQYIALHQFVILRKQKDIKTKAESE